MKAVLKLFIQEFTDDVHLERIIEILKDIDKQK